MKDTGRAHDSLPAPMDWMRTRIRDTPQTDRMHPEKPTCGSDHVFLIHHRDGTGGSDVRSWRVGSHRLSDGRSVKRRFDEDESSGEAEKPRGY